MNATDAKQLIDASGITVTAVAKELRMPRTTLNLALVGKKPLSQIKIANVVAAVDRLYKARDLKYREACDALDQR